MTVGKGILIIWLCSLIFYALNILTFANLILMGLIGTLLLLILPSK